MNPVINSTEQMTTYGDFSEEKQSGGIKRKGETLSNSREAKQFCAEVLQKEGSLISLPKELLISIIQKATLVQLLGLAYSCRKFHLLVFTYVNTIVLVKEEEKLWLQPTLKKLVDHDSCKKLKTLVTWFLPSLNSRGLFNEECLSLVSRFTNLTALILGKKQDTSLSREGLLHLTALQKLTRLEIECCEVDASAVTPVLRSLTCLTNLRIRGISLKQSNSLISSLATTSLRRLGIWSGQGQILESEFAHLCRNIELQELILASCFADIPDSFKYISQLTRLGHLSLHCDDISNQQLARLKTMTNLCSLNLGGCWILENEGASSLIQLSKLTHLALTGVPRITGDFLKKISAMGLKVLHLMNCIRIKDEDIETLSSILTLTRLDLAESSLLSNIALKNVAKHPHLCELRLTNLPNIDDDGIKFLVGMVKLTFLFVKNCINIKQVGIDFLLKNHVNSWMNDLKVIYKVQDQGEGLVDQM